MASSPDLGNFIRDNVIPPGLTVSEAARRLGVGRPALSNLLNGNASLSAEMALKLERTFGADSEVLLSRQAEIDAVAQQEADTIATARRNAAGYFKITASDIALWATSQEARALLPVLLRRLVHATANQPTKVDFPGYDEAQRHGWDGQVETKDVSAWVPEGFSGWELSVSNDLPAKPNYDIRARAKLSKPEKARTAFIFATGRKWIGKEKWAAEQRAHKEWRDVIAYDASDLEQWLEQSATTQVWFAECLGRPADGVRSLDACWVEWAEATTPRLSPLLFDGAIAQHRQALMNWLAKPGERPFVVVADSPAEALGFLACALREPDGAEGPNCAETICVSSPEALRKIAAASLDAILIVENRDTELAAVSLFRKHRVIIIRPRSSIEKDPDIALEAIDDDTFSKALEDMGVGSDEVDRLKAESGLSSTILRRRLALAPELKTPDWARDKDLVRKVIPILLAGAWNRSVEADQFLVAELSDRPYNDVEKDLASLLAVPDSPVWIIGNYRGLVSRKDALFAVRGAIDQADIDRFFSVAELVLTEDDPSLDLPPEDRWMADMRGKARQISAALRQAIGELLVLLAVYGDQQLDQRVGPISVRIDHLVLDILKGRKARNWLSQHDVLPVLAEAAPKAFLEAIEADLRSDQPQILAMLRPTGVGPFDSPDRSGLLWALETIAWNPEYLLRVARILARLSEVPIDDNWGNKPENSLGSLVRSWMPQTAADIGMRMKIIEIVAREHPEVGWRLCLSQIDTWHRFASLNVRPRWRGDAAGAGSVVTRGEDYDMRRKALDLLVAWPSLDETKLGDLIEHANELPDEDQNKILARADEWLAGNPNDEARGHLRERIRRHVLMSRRRSKGRGQTFSKQMRDLSERLTPSDLIAGHRWLFAEHYVTEARDELEEDSLDFDARHKRIDAQRRAAVREIFDARGLPGVLALLKSGNAWSAVGWNLAENVTSQDDQLALVRKILAVAADSSRRELDGCLEGFFRQLDDKRRQAITRALSAEDDAIDKVSVLRLFKVSPFSRTTWDLLEDTRPDLVDRYWHEVSPYGWGVNDADLNLLVARLLAADRPLAAFNSVSHAFDKIEAAALARLMQAVTKASAREAELNKIDGHRVSDALSALDKSGTLSTEEMAQLEYLFVDALTFSERGIPNLERQIATSPADFVRLVAILFRRDDDGVDPPELTLSENVNKEAIGSNIFRVLEKISRIPGTRDDGQIDAAVLIEWLKEARQRLKGLGRSDVGDDRIGTLLAKAPVGSDGIWPHEAVREALEEASTENIARGMCIGLHNSRGAVWRGLGGNQEHALAEKYADFARRVESDHPFTARMLDGIAASYLHDAKWYDTDEAVRRRLRG